MRPGTGSVYQRPRYGFEYLAGDRVMQPRAPQAAAIALPGFGANVVCASSAIGDRLEDVLKHHAAGADLRIVELGRAGSAGGGGRRLEPTDFRERKTPVMG